MRATPTRWDLLSLCEVELARQAAGHPPLLCAVPPNAGHLKHNMLQEELGPYGTGEHRYTSPYEVLASNLKGVTTIPRPPLWFVDSTTSPPQLPTEPELRQVLAWWERNKTSKRGDAPSAKLAAGSSQVLSGDAAQRPSKRPRRLVEE